MKKNFLLFVFSALLIASAVGQTGVVIGPDMLDLTLSHYTNQLVDTLEININNGSDTPLGWEISAKAEPVTFEKENYADYTLPENQDRITDNVWITRDNDEGLFNAATEAYYEDEGYEGPDGTEWAKMPTGLCRVGGLWNLAGQCTPIPWRCGNGKNCFSISD